jgi:HAD superfamily hydrolase (TIGR01549 family)
VLLDLDDTLIEEESFARAQLRATATLVEGIDPESWDDVVIESARALWRTSEHFPTFAELGFASWEGLWATFDGGHPRLAEVARWAHWYRHEAWQRALRTVGNQQDAADALSERYIEGQRSGHPLLPGAMELVQSLSAEVPVAVVTNGPADIQRLKIDQAGIGPHLTAVVISGETGIGKPDPGAFGAALDLLGVSPQHAVMVGDSWERDVSGAVAAGLRAVWISQGRSAPGSHPGVDFAHGPRDVCLF